MCPPTPLPVTYCRLVRWSVSYRRWYHSTPLTHRSFFLGFLQYKIRSDLLSCLLCRMLDVSCAWAHILYLNTLLFSTDMQWSQAPEARPTSSFLLSVSCMDKGVFGSTHLGTVTLPSKELTTVALKVRLKSLFIAEYGVLDRESLHDPLRRP